MPANTFDPTYPANPNIVPVHQEDSRRTPVTLMDKTYTAMTTNTNEVVQLDMSQYMFAFISVYQTSAWTGTTPTLQLDLIAVSDDGVNTNDYFNAGPKNGGFVYQMGPGGATNQLPPKNLTFSYKVGGTTPSVNFRIVVQAW